MFRLDHDGPIARLILDRAASRNAIPAQGWAELDALLSELRVRDHRLLLVSGAEGAFCAGADLRDFASMSGDEKAASRFRKEMRSAIERLAELPMPTIARITGPCFGAGVALALACDLRLASPDARFAIPPAKIGLSYPQEDVHRLVATVGAGAAARLLFSALPIDAGEAQRIGLADIVEEQEMTDVVRAIAGNVAESLFALKDALRLAGRGIRQDDEQDRRFDRLAAGEKLAGRIAGR